MKNDGGSSYGYGCMLFYPQPFLCCILNIYLENAPHSNTSYFYRVSENNNTLSKFLLCYFALTSP